MRLYSRSSHHRRLATICAGIVFVLALGIAAAWQKRIKVEAQAEAAQLAFLDDIPAATTRSPLPEDFFCPSPRPWTLPLQYRYSPTSMSFEPGEPEPFERLQARLRRHLISKYPVGLLMQDVRSAVICSHLRVFGVEAGGTWGPNIILVSYATSWSPSSDEHVQRTLDHEITNVLLNNHPFPESRLRALSCDEIQYGEGGVAAIRAGRVGKESTPRLLSCGFVDEYASASYREDACTISWLVFSNPEQAWAWRKSYPRIWAKVMLFGEYLRSIDEEWYNAFRRSLAAARPKE